MRCRQIARVDSDSEPSALTPAPQLPPDRARSGNRSTTVLEVSVDRLSVFCQVASLVPIGNHHLKDVQVRAMSQQPLTPATATIAKAGVDAKTGSRRIQRASRFNWLCRRALIGRNANTFSRSSRS